MVQKAQAAQTQSAALESGPRANALELLRVQVAEDLMPVIRELAEKYEAKGLAIRMNASNFLQGGRNVELEFAFGEYRTCLHGTVTSEGIAFEETRYAPNIDGEITSGPMLRARQLNATTFRGFACDQLSLLLKSALRKP